MSTHLIGDAERVILGLRQLQERTGADEIMLSTRAHSYEARLRSLTLIARGWETATQASGNDDSHQRAASVSHTD